MPRTKISTSFSKQPNTARLTESRVYRFQDGTSTRLVAEVSGPIGDQAGIENCLEELHETFRLRLVESNHVISEVGELRERKAQYLFTAPFAETGGDKHGEGPNG